MAKNLKVLFAHGLLYAAVKFNAVSFHSSALQLGTQELVALQPSALQSSALQSSTLQWHQFKVVACSVTKFHVVHCDCAHIQFIQVHCSKVHCNQVYCKEMHQNKVLCSKKQFQNSLENWTKYCFVQGSLIICTPCPTQIYNSFKYTAVKSGPSFVFIMKFDNLYPNQVQ